MELSILINMPDWPNRCIAFSRDDVGTAQCYPVRERSVRRTADSRIVDYCCRVDYFSSSVKFIILCEKTNVDNGEKLQMI